MGFLILLGIVLAIIIAKRKRNSDGGVVGASSLASGLLLGRNLIDAGICIQCREHYVGLALDCRCTNYGR